MSENKKLRTVKEVLEWIDKDISEHREEWSKGKNKFVDGAMTALGNLRSFIEIPVLNPLPEEREPVTHQFLNFKSSHSNKAIDAFTIWMQDEDGKDFVTELPGKFARVVFNGDVVKKAAKVRKVLEMLIESYSDEWSNYMQEEVAEAIAGAKKWTEPEVTQTTPESSEREPVYRWVKAEERLPQKAGKHNEVTIRSTTGFGKDPFGHDYPHAFQTTGFKNYDEKTPRFYFLIGNKSFLTNENVEWLEQIPAPISQPAIDSERQKAFSGEYIGELGFNPATGGFAITEPVAPPIPESLPTEVQCPNCLGEGTEVLSEFGPETCRCCGGLKSVAMDTWEYWTKEYGGNPIPTPVSSKMEHTEMPDGYGIVYDKVFIPCKQGVGEDYPSSICDFDYNKQKWVPGDFFIKPVPGPVAVIPAKHYEVLQASLSSIKAERDEARQLSFLISRDVEAFRAERDLYRTESEAHKKAKEEPKP